MFNGFIRIDGGDDDYDDDDSSSDDYGAEVNLCNVCIYMYMHAFTHC